MILGHKPVKCKNYRQADKRIKALVKNAVKKWKGNVPMEYLSGIAYNLKFEEASKEEEEEEEESENKSKAISFLYDEIFSEVDASRMEPEPMKSNCPAQNQDPIVCAKYGCSKRRQRHNLNKNTSMTDRPPLYVDNEADVEDIDGPTCFDDFDFFRPTSFEQLDEEGEGSSENSSVTRTPVDLNSLNAVIHTRSATMTSATIAENAKEESLKQGSRSRSARSSNAVDKEYKNELIPTGEMTGQLELNEANHPSDCSWASSSSSTTSSSHSLTYPIDRILAPTEQDENSRNNTLNYR